MIDLMGYVGAVLMDRRYNDTDRDVLLDCAETQVRVAHSLAPVVFARFEYLGDWVLAAVGTYLLLAGPNPSSPSDSYYDERVQSSSPAKGRGLRRAERHAWPEVLLNQWQPATDGASAASHALATVCGWDASRGRWLVNLIFDRSRDEQRDLSREFWLRTLEDLLERVSRVRIATNPWRTSNNASTRDNMVMTDEKGRFIIPDGVLRAAAAQGLRAGEIATVHGRLFQGRRVPTFLLTNRFGPYAILKIDHRDKVLREREHFDTYARRLHQSHRPSECHAHPMDLYLGQSGAAVRAIETAYVFEPRDQPLTMTEWTARSTADEVSAVIKDLLCEDLRPWLAHVHRDRVDLRAEYPVFRPGPVEGKQAPANYCAEELTKLERADLGASLSRTERDCPWLAVLPGSSALSGMPTPVCPLWFAAEIAEIGTGALSWVMDARDIALRDFDTLLSLSHGDLHLDNVLCTSAKSGIPHAVLIDFESAHDGHVCKDIARLEASFLCQVFEPDAVFAERVAAWFAGSISTEGALFTPPLTDESDARVRLVMTAIRQLRQVVTGCGQGHWPIRYDEYVFALIGALLPMARYTTLKMSQRQLALLLSAMSAGYLVRHWESRGSGV